MASRKPTSVFVFTNDPSHEQVKNGRPTNWACHRIPLDGNTPDNVVKGFLEGKTPGLEFAWVDDTKPTAGVLAVDVVPVEDMRLSQ